MKKDAIMAVVDRISNMAHFFLATRPMIVELYF